MRALRVVLAVIAIVLAPVAASAATIHGLVYDDANGDGKPSAGERGIAGAVVAFDVQKFVETDASGQFDMEVPDAQPGIVWVRVPDGFAPGPVWGRWDEPVGHAHPDQAGLRIRHLQVELAARVGLDELLHVERDHRSGDAALARRGLAVAVRVVVDEPVDRRC